MPADHSSRAPIRVVAGAPGAGKGTAAGLLLARLRPVPALLDKDTMYSGFAGAVLAEAGRSLGEREGPWYDEHIKVHEYGGMTAVARQIRRHGCPVLLDGPFTTQIREPARWSDWVAELGGEPVELIWVGCSPSVLRQRLLQRARPQDAGKLTDYDAWLRRMQPDIPPRVPHVALDNSGTEQDLSDQVDHLVRRLTGENA